MRKGFLVALCISIAMIFTSCGSNKVNPNIAKTGLDKEKIQRINIINNRSSQKYTFSQERNKERFKNIVLKAVEVSEDPKLDPDFTFDFYSETKKIASFKYIAGISDKKVANLIDENNKLYHIDDSIENEFFKRMIKAKSDDYVPEYYTSLIEKVLEKLPKKDNVTAVVDIRKDYIVTRNLMSVDQKRILDNISKDGIEVKYPGEVENPDYYITVNTKSYNGARKDASAVVSVKDSNNVTVKFEVKLTSDGKFYIRLL